jgi:hypothetical protein
LPPEIQKRFNYDPVKAKAAAEARVKDAAENAKALQAEMDLASQQRQAGPEPQETPAPETSSSAALDAGVPSVPPTSADASHHSMDELASSAHSLQSDPSDPTHHSIYDLSASTSAMRRDLSDPTYHTMAHLVFSIHSLGPDPSDPNHHTISEISDSGL